MTRAAILALALAGCSAEPTADPPSATPSATSGAASSTRAGSSESTSAGETLTGAVSNLSGASSDLNVRVTDTRTIVDLPADTLFEFDKAELTPAAIANLPRVAELIRAGGAGSVEVSGHTDAKGDDAYNQALSQRRAQAVADWMREQVGVRQRTFVVQGRGETQPVAPNTRPDGSDDPDGRSRNRRVEVSIPR